MAVPSTCMHLCSLLQYDWMHVCNWYYVLCVCLFVVASAISTLLRLLSAWVMVVQATCINKMPLRRKGKRQWRWWRWRRRWWWFIEWHFDFTRGDQIYCSHPWDYTFLLCHSAVVVPADVAIVGVIAVCYCWSCCMLLFLLLLPSPLHLLYVYFDAPAECQH